MEEIWLGGIEEKKKDKREDVWKMGENRGVST